MSFTLGAEGPPVDGAERMDSGLFDQGPVYVAIGAREERLAVNAGYPLSSYSGAVSAVASMRLLHPRAALSSHSGARSVARRRMHIHEHAYTAWHEPDLLTDQ